MLGELDELNGRLIVGIDLGTTQSAVAVRDADGLRVLADSAGDVLTPSVVGWDSRRAGFVVGRDGQSLAEHHPAAVAYSLKRYIGRWFTDPAVMYGRRDLTYQLVNGGGNDQLRDILVDFGHDARQAPLRLSIPDVSAKVLSKLRYDAATALDTPVEAVTHAVITVPAYFNVLQRRATRLAGETAGLQVVDILNEPTAAALAYADSILGPDERKILVYDLGGGTFDVALLEASRDEVGYQFYTRLVDGDTRLGGDDIDARLVQWLIDEIARRYGDRVRPDDLITRARLRTAAEHAKITLSTERTCQISLPRLELGSRPAFDARLEITREQVEACAQDAISRARTIVRRAVEDVAGLTWPEIDEVILVGGQTLMPAVQRDVEEFSGHAPRVNDKPYLAVALGAAEYAHILAQGQERFQENTLINVIALPLGIRLDEDTFHPIVRGNVTVPHTSDAFPVTTTTDNQTDIKIDVLQGRQVATRASDCVLLGTIDMEVPPLPAGAPRFDIVFDVRPDGTFKVMVTDTRRQRTKDLDVVENQTLVWVDEPVEEGEHGRGVQ